MRKVFLIGTGLALLGGGGVALAQVPPGGPDGMERDTGPHERMEMHHMHMRPRGAAFRFRKGDTEIDIRCAVREPMQACVAAASALMDKVSSMQPAKTTP